MDTVFSLLDGDPTLAPDAKPRVDFYAQLEKERAKVGVGMVSQRYQRLERRLLGKQVGPDTLDRGSIGAPAGSVGFGASAPPEPPSSKPLKPPKRTPNDHALAAEYSRFLPAANDGKATPRQALYEEGVWAVKRRSHAVAHAMGNPQRVCLQLTPEVRKRLSELGVTSGGMLRPAPNPLRDVAKMVKSQAEVKRPSRMPAAGSPRSKQGLPPTPRALPPNSPRRVDSGAIKPSAPLSAGLGGARSGRLERILPPSPRGLGQGLSFASDSALSAREGRSPAGGRAGAPVRPGPPDGGKCGGNKEELGGAAVRMKLMAERREAAMRRKVNQHPIYVYVYVYIYTYLCIFFYMYMYIYLYISIDLSLSIYIDVYVEKYDYTFTIYIYRYIY